MREIIKTENAPKAIGPYSQGIKVGNLVFTAAQIPIVPETGELVPGGIEEQTHQVMKNLSAILAAAGTSLDNAIKVTVYITDMKEFATVNKVYGEYFKGDCPARACVESPHLAKEALVEIEVVALCK